MIFEMNGWQWASVILAFALYVPLGSKILKKKVVQNLATFILWGSLDLLAGASIVAQGGTNYALPFAYVLGCTFVVSCILRVGTYSWTRLETRATIIVTLCAGLWTVVVWGLQNSQLATILSTSGVLIAGIPQLRDSLADPETVPVPEYAGYTLANIFSTIGGASWTIADRLFPAACTVLCAVFVVIGLRKPSKESLPAHAREIFDNE